MRPIIFEASANDFTSNGLGGLSDAVSCVVTEERNGVYELEMQYPIDGAHFDEIKISRIIKTRVHPEPDSTTQLFRIYAIDKPINGIVTVYAEHVSYQLSYIPVAPFTAGSAAAAMAGMATNAMTTCPFTFWTDKQTTANYKQEVPDNIRARLGGTSGSILDVYGGEYEFDNYVVKLWNHRGHNNGVTLRYGKNITDIEQEENIASTYTSIVGYWQGEDAEVHTAVRDSASAANFPYKRVKVVDFSSEFEDQPTVAQLNSKADSYMNANNFGIPKVNIKVSFISLDQTEEYKEIAPLERVFLCDTVNVQFEKLGISTAAKVVKTKFDVLGDRYESIEIGEARANLANTIADMDTDITQEIEDTRSDLEKAVDRATKAITGQKGGYLKFKFNANNEPYEMLIMDHDTEAASMVMWRYNLSGWAVTTDGGENYTMAATFNEDVGLEIVADFITAGHLSANIIYGGLLMSNDSVSNPNFSLDMATGNLIARALEIITSTLKWSSSNGTIISEDTSVSYSIKRSTIGQGVIKAYYDYTLHEPGDPMWFVETRMEAGGVKFYSDQWDPEDMDYSGGLFGSSGGVELKAVSGGTVLVGSYSDNNVTEVGGTEVNLYTDDLRVNTNRTFNGQVYDANGTLRNVVNGIILD